MNRQPIGNPGNPRRLAWRPAAVFTALGAGLLVPVCSLGATGLAATGGGGSGGSGLTGPSTTPVSTKKPLVHKVNTPVSVQGNGIMLATIASGETGHKLTFTGTASPAGDQIEIEYRSGPKAAWRKAGTPTITSADTFKLVWHASAAGRLAFRAVLIPPPVQAPVGVTTPAATTALATPSLAVTVFRAAKATFYGPGFWNHRTACGQKLRRNTLGVANRTLKCGTKVSLYYQGREIVVRVIDRGPYGSLHANWDLTMATAKALGITETVTLGALG
jgi:rare lipoprotein A